jgi:hypothetical protein
MLTFGTPEVVRRRLFLIAYPDATMVPDDSAFLDESFDIPAHRHMGNAKRLCELVYRRCSTFAKHFKNRINSFIPVHCHHHKILFDRFTNYPYNLTQIC